MTKRLEVEEIVISGHEFRLGTNRIGERLTEYATYEWVDWLDLSAGVDTTRGGSTSELNNLEIGLLTAQFPNLDPSSITPGQAVRVVSERPPVAALLEASIESIGVAPFAGAWTTTEDVAAGIRLTAAANVQLATTVPADAVAGTPATIKIVVAAVVAGVTFTAPALPAGWAASHTGTVPVGAGFTYTATGPAGAVVPAGTFTRATNPCDVTIGQWSVEYTKAVVPAVQWQGKANDVVSVDRKDGSSQVAVTSSDAMTQITSALISGVVGADDQTFRQRAEALESAGHGIDFTIDDAGTGGSRIEPTWTTWGALPATVVVDQLAPVTEQFATGALAGTLYQTRSTAAVTQNSTTSGIQANLTGLTSGNVYKLTARLRSTFKTTSGDWADLYRFGIAGIGWSDQFRIGKYADDTVTVTYTFTATAATHAMRLTLAERLSTAGAGIIESVVIGDLYLIDQSADPYRLGDNVMEGSLADHLNLMCDSVGGIWRPTVNAGIVVNRFITPGIKAGFSDEADAMLSYTSLAMSYSTQDVINVLRLRNIGAYADATAGETTHVYEDSGSVAKWGRRSREIKTNLLYASMVDTRAVELLKEHSEPSYQPTSLTYRTEDLPVAPDIHDAVIVRRRGVDYTALVVGIDQRLSPKIRETDLTTLTLRNLK